MIIRLLGAGGVVALCLLGVTAPAPGAVAVGNAPMTSLLSLAPAWSASTSTFSPGRFGPVTMGVKASTAAGLGVLRRVWVDPDGCPSAPYEINRARFGDRWYATIDYHSPYRLRELGTSSTSARTTKGIRVGSSVVAVQRAYPGARWSVGEDYGTTWLSVGSRSTGWLDFVMTEGPRGLRVASITVRQGSFPLFEGDGC